MDLYDPPYGDPYERRLARVEMRHDPHYRNVSFHAEVEVGVEVSQEMLHPRGHGDPRPGDEVVHALTRGCQAAIEEQVDRHMRTSRGLGGRVPNHARDAAMHRASLMFDTEEFMRTVAGPPAAKAKKDEPFRHRKSEAEKRIGRAILNP